MDINYFFKNVTDRLELLREKSVQNALYLSAEYNYDINYDIRTYIFTQIDRLILYHDLNMINFVCNISNHEILHKWINTSEEDSLKVATDYISRNKQSLITFLQIILEEYFRELCPILKITCPQSFSIIISNLFDYLKIDKSDDKYKALCLLSRIRNTMHNNGIHRQKDEDIVYHNKTYSFKFEKTHNCADYDTIITIISDTIEFLLYLGIETNNICTIKSLIKPA